MPALDDVISDLFPDPWSLHDITAYLSKSHCLETIQFLQDASKYRDCYAEIVDNTRIPDDILERHHDYLRGQWDDLMITYIVSDGDRELNLPSQVRCQLLATPSSKIPPHPSELDNAVKIIRDLLEGSILTGLLNSGVSSEQLSDGDGGSLRRKFSNRIGRIPSSTERDHRRNIRQSNDSTSRVLWLGADDGVALCTRSDFLRDATYSTSGHLSRRAVELFNHTVRRVRRVRSLKQLKTSSEKNGVAGSRPRLERNHSISE
ncbi:hypothetical protein EDB81DRAFT_910439 [Dactylonectria macrodidyma]|uniref:RGS domain-containing protein n=1 Tax=Dactylonectria macrodidyma TaxID=307937 RepID=A0A9P9DV30_9HYPO|nr:hypothetical protein EDB81DRAFT_910439 [Dactylonectria macrodidyma]